jgi:hypothetical protein
MKKQITFGIGIIAVSIASLSFIGAAGGKDYHFSYLRAQKAKVIVSEDGSRPYYPVASTLGQRWYDSQDLAIRPNTNSIRAYWGKRENKPLSTRPQAISSVYSNYTQVASVKPITNTQTYQNNQFSLQLPNGFTEIQSGTDQSIYSNNNGVKVMVKKYQKGICSTEEELTNCAGRISEEINNINNIIPNTNVSKQTQFMDTILNTKIQTRTYIENFSASIGDKQDVYIFNRNFVADTDGGLYLIEAISSNLGSGDFARLTQDISNSFKIYPTYQNIANQYNY